MPKLRRTGETVTWKEFFRRWKDASQPQNMTPLDQAKVSLLGIYIIIAGTIWGLAATFYFKQWWMFTVLCGALMISYANMSAITQRYKATKKMSDLLKGGFDTNE